MIYKIVILAMFVYIICQLSFIIDIFDKAKVIKKKKRGRNKGNKN